MAIPQLYQCFQKWGEQGTLWIYSDTHFNDPDLRAGVGSRPDDETQLKMINAKAGRKDTLIHLGDVGDIEFVKRLRAGRKILITGNHDAGATNYAEVFDEIYTGPLMIAPQVILSHEPIPTQALKAIGAVNIHGHDHAGKPHIDQHHYNVCADVIGYTPLNMNQWFKSGPTARIPDIHRVTIDGATDRARKRGYSLKKGKK